MSSLPYLRRLTLFVACMLQALGATSLKIEVTNDGQGRSGGQTVFANTPFAVTVSVLDGDQDTGSVELAVPNQIKVMGRSHSTSISMVNGKYSSQVAHVYQLYALQEGPIKIGPARLKNGDQSIESNVLDLTVAKAPEQPQSEKKPAVLCRLTADKKTVVVGEPVVVRLTILSRGQITQFGMEPQKFSGFMVKEIQKDIHRREEFNKVMYDVFEKRFVLIPSEQGQKVIDPVKLAYNVPVRIRQQNRGLFGDPFFSAFFEQDRVEQKITISNALSITVDPLPEDQGQIDGVGEFMVFHASLNKKEAYVNEALTLKLELVGMGNLDQVPTPKLILPPFIKAYESKASIQEDLTTDYHGGKKSFEYVVQIAQEGDAEIPSQLFTYFDTRTKTIKTLKTPVLPVHLTPGAQAQPPKISVALAEEREASPLPQKTRKQDISFIQEDGPITRRSRDNGTGINLFIFLFLVFLVPLIIFGKNLIGGMVKWCLPRFFKGRIHKKQIAKLYQELDALHKSNQGDKLYQFFVKLLATVAGTSVEAVTHEWLHEYLIKEQWQEKRIGEFFDFLNECARCNFVSYATPSKSDFNELFKKSSHWLLSLTSLQSSERSL